MPTLEHFLTALQETKNGYLAPPGPNFGKRFRATAYKLPIFDFSIVENDFVDAAMLNLKKSACDAFQDGKLPQPFPYVLYVLKDHIFYAEEVRGNDGRIEFWSRMFSFHSGMWISPAMWSTMKTTGVGYVIDEGMEKQVDSLLPNITSQIHHVTERVAIFTYLLATPHSHTTIRNDPIKIPIHEGSRTKSETIGPIRQVGVDVAWLREYDPKGSTHAPPVPHLRRAHQRRLNNGVIVPVRACRIRGGRKNPYVILRDEIASSLVEVGV